MHGQEFINFKLLLHFHMKLSNILLAIPVTKFTHLQTFQYEIMNDIHNKNECGVGWSIKKTNESEIHFER